MAKLGALIPIAIDKTCSEIMAKTAIKYIKLYQRMVDLGEFGRISLLPQVLNKKWPASYIDMLYYVLMVITI